MGVWGADTGLDLAWISIGSLCACACVFTLRDTLGIVEAHNANDSGRSLVLSRGAQWTSALAAWLVHAALVVSCVVVACGYMPSDSGGSGVGSALQEQPSLWRWVGWLLAGYNLCVTLSRGWLVGPWVMFEAQWCCNHALLLAGLGMVTGRPLLVGIAVLGICCDVLCWFVDAFFLFALRRKPPIGVMTFLTKPQRHVVQVLTTLHHFWFMPVCLLALGWEVPAGSWAGSCVFTCAATLFSRVLSPRHVFIPHKQEDTQRKRVAKGELYYLNVNAAYEFWKEVEIPVLHWFDEYPFPVYYAYIACVGNVLLNGGVATLVLFPLLQLMHACKE